MPLREDAGGEVGALGASWSVRLEIWRPRMSGRWLRWLDRAGGNPEGDLEGTFANLCKINLKLNPKKCVLCWETQ